MVEMSVVVFAKRNICCMWFIVDQPVWVGRLGSCDSTQGKNGGT